MIAALPLEILIHLATYVEKEDRLNCALVCNQWTEPFLDAYWARIDIDNNTLQKMFNKFSQTNDSVKTKLDWSLWETLSHLEIQFYRKELVLETIFEQLSVLTCLVHLEISRAHSSEENFSTYLTDFESLHRHLPRLEYIDIHTFIKPIHEREIEMIRRVEPAHSIRTVIFSSDAIDTLWIFYFAHKYPNLLSFDLAYHAPPRSLIPRSCEDPQYQSRLQILLSLKQFFPCLQITKTITRNNEFWLHRIFHDALQHFNVKIKYPKITYFGETLEENDISDWIKYFSESAIFLHVSSIFAVRAEAKLLVPCHKLTVLYINYTTMLDMENILDNCPVLQSLYICYSYICSPEYPQPTHLPHSLQKLDIKHTKMNSHTFKYISFRCEQLKYMKLEDIRLYHSDSEETGQLLVDMPFSQLKILSTSDITFFFENNFLYAYKCVKHFVIEQLKNVSINRLDQSNQERTPLSNWYHVCIDETNGKERIFAWELGKRDIEFAQRYYKDFRRRSQQDKERNDMEEFGKGYKIKRFWKRDLKDCVLIFRFKSVEDCSIEESSIFKHVHSRLGSGSGSGSE
ncbi:hypothetical protein J3Q64DRAFT_1837915 [Phycomyces blakesleeanus]|uniref:F-box domain-containing protein n=1 Tax=Phycomyces blakesleeanus TaxID=4837 RepID=A0ABR3AVZ4_PHYBL